jgi:hypothetical protein
MQRCPSADTFGHCGRIYRVGSVACYFAISQICPPGSTKLAVRIPHGRSIGPFSSSTPRAVSSAHRASTSSKVIVCA